MKIDLTKPPKAVYNKQEKHNQTLYLSIGMGLLMALIVSVGTFGIFYFVFC
jgi:hypothetical protein